jgi:uncharacterized protein
MQRFSDIAFTPEVEAYQRQRGSLDHYRQAAAAWGPPEALGAPEAAFLAARDSIYLASVGVEGWPYVQHRGGPVGFIAMLGPTTIGWLDRPGNKQFVTAGNLVTSTKVAIIAVDYPNRQRLKLYGHARFDPNPDPTAMAAFGSAGRAEGAIIIDIIAYDWNCPKYITPRFTAQQVREITDPLQATITGLEQQLAELREQPTPTGDNK